MVDREPCLAVSPKMKKIPPGVLDKIRFEEIKCRGSSRTEKKKKQFSCVFVGIAFALPIKRFVFAFEVGLTCFWGKVFVCSLLTIFDQVSLRGKHIAPKEFILKNTFFHNLELTNNRKKAVIVFTQCIERRSW